VFIPAFSLAEPYIALMHKGNERMRLIPELRKHLSELGRSKPYRTASDDFAELTTLLIDSVESERMRLQVAADGVLDAAEIIPLTAGVFREAKAFRFGFDMSFQDSIVLASVVLHLMETKPAESCFLNRNTKDFADPNIRDVLDGFGCVGSLVDSTMRSALSRRVSAVRSNALCSRAAANCRFHPGHAPEGRGADGRAGQSPSLPDRYRSGSCLYRDCSGDTRVRDCGDRRSRHAGAGPRARHGG
jgi:hypothetical protein